MIKILDDVHNVTRVIQSGTPIRPWRFMVLHHTVTEADINKLYGKLIDAIHREGDREGYPSFKNGMGYHFLINPNGVIQYGDRWYHQIYGAHTLGYNKVSIGIALVGNFSEPQNHPSSAQIKSLHKLMAAIHPMRLYPHCAFRETECPGRLFDNLRTWFRIIDLAPIQT